MDDDLLGFALAAHGGLSLWNSFNHLSAAVTIEGAIWRIKQAVGLLVDKHVDIDTHRQKVIIDPFGVTDGSSVFDHGQLRLTDGDGATVETRADPAAAFGGQALATPWDRLQVAYFASEALWTYLTAPFLFAYPGFECEEIEPWFENGERWRSLQVRFPDHLASHCRTHIVRFGPDGLMRRHDYTVDILGGATGANYVGLYREVQGLMMPTRRRVYAYDPAMRKIPEPLLVSLDFGALVFS